MDNNLAKIAAERVAKARAELILSRTFYGVLVGQVVPVASDQFPTMATNGKQHFYNPAFIAELTQDELLAVQAHESEHDARRHHTRRGGRDPVRWNKATDYGINIDLVDAGFKLPKDVLLDPRFRGMSAEDIYRTLEIEETMEQPEPEDEPEADEDEGEDEGDTSDADPTKARATSPKLPTRKATRARAKTAKATSRTATKARAATPRPTMATSPAQAQALATRKAKRRAKARTAATVNPATTASRAPANRPAIPAVWAKCSTRPKTLLTLPTKMPSGNE